jgi:hypothetical protein
LRINNPLPAEQARWTDELFQEGTIVSRFSHNRPEQTVEMGSRRIRNKVDLNATTFALCKSGGVLVTPI